MRPAIAIAVPTTGLAIICITLIIIEGLAASSSYWSGDIPLPYISDTGRDPPNYYVFAIGGTASASLFAIQHALLSPAYVRATHARPGCWRMSWYLACILSIVAMVALSMLPRTGPAGLPCRSHLASPALMVRYSRRNSRWRRSVLLVCFNTNDYPAVHDAGAYTFFVLMAFALPLFTFSLFCLRRVQPEAVNPHSLRVKLVLTVCFWVAFIIYLPVGLAVVCTWNRLPLQSCKVTHQLGDAYCDSKLLTANESACAAPPCTVLWDYSGCPEINTLRAVFQLASVLLLLLFQGTFFWENQYVARGGGDATISKAGDGISPAV